MGEKLCIFLYSDASPQRGAEFFATTADFYDGESWTRVLLPAIALDPSCMDGIGKTLCLLWQIWLLVGPRWEDLLLFTNHVVIPYLKTRIGPTSSGFDHF